jgi:hypothetical protein
LTTIFNHYLNKMSALQYELRQKKSMTAQVDDGESRANAIPSVSSPILAAESVKWPEESIAVSSVSEEGGGSAIANMGTRTSFRISAAL